MSTQSISNSTIETVQHDIDNALACISRRFILEDRFGVKNEVNNRDIFTIVYYKRLLEQRYCKQDLNSDGIEKLKKILIKYT